MAQFIKQQTRCHIGVVRLILYHGACGNEQRSGNVCAADAVVHVIQCLRHYVLSADIVEPLASFKYERMNAFDIKEFSLARFIDDVQICMLWRNGDSGLLLSQACAFCAIQNIGSCDLMFA